MTQQFHFIKRNLFSSLVNISLLKLAHVCKLGLTRNYTYVQNFHTPFINTQEHVYLHVPYMAPVIPVLLVIPDQYECKEF